MSSTTTMLDIRAARTADIPALQRVIAGAFDQYRATLAPTVFEAYLDDLLDVAGRMDVGDVLVAAADGEIVGTVTFVADGHGLGMAWPQGWSVFRALGVAPQRRSRGAGRALVATCIDRAAAVGAEVLGLHTASFMTAAVDLYERAGFRRAPSFDITPDAILDVSGDDLPPVLAYVGDVA